MQDVSLYLDGQTQQAKLVYTVGLLWGQISSKLDSELLKYNLNISKFNILMIIKHAGGQEGIQQNEISKRLLVTASNITKLLDKLEKEGMITRNSKKDDKRVKLIKVTDIASKLLDDIWVKHENEINRITENLDEQNLIQLNQSLSKWLTELT